MLFTRAPHIIQYIIIIMFIYMAKLLDLDLCTCAGLTVPSSGPYMGLSECVLTLERCFGGFNHLPLLEPQSMLGPDFLVPPCDF